MKNIGKIFNSGFQQVLCDGMLLILIPAPFLMGLALKLLVPFVNKITLTELGFSIVPWYSLSDALLIVMTPVMIAMVCAFIILDERDEGIGIYYLITPGGGRTYLVSRVILPMIWGLISTILVVSFFSLSVKSLLVVILCAFVGTMQGIVSCMILVTIAGNKVEGLALAKLTNILMIGFVFPWFITSPVKYIFGILPGFWIGELLQQTDRSQGSLFLLGLTGVVFSILWILVLYRKFLQKVY